LLPNVIRPWPAIATVSREGWRHRNRNRTSCGAGCRVKHLVVVGARGRSTAIQVELTCRSIIVAQTGSTAHRNEIQSATHTDQEGYVMDITTITEVVRRPPERPGTLWQAGDAWLAGGTWLFSDKQPALRRLIDLAPLGWDSVTYGDDGLEIGATCTIAELYAFAAQRDLRAGPLLRTSCEAFLASFKIWNSATVGGNICMSLPAGPMITMTVALEATYTLWGADGSERVVEAAEFVTGDNKNILRPGEVLRSIHIPAHALRKRHTHRRFTLTRLGRSTIFMIATQSPDTDDLLLTITAGTTHPVRLAFDAMPTGDALQHLIDSISDDVWFDDANGAPDHRQHLAKYYAEQIRTEFDSGVHS
jgi:CO/xanthine dehydrogenase FAD-binding subunit